MAFPTTQMSGYTDLKGRITLALSRCQEQSWLDFKESQPWPVLRWRLLKTIMGMANLRDGGLIVVGVAEKGTAWELTGIEASHLAAFDYDDITDQLSKYASPQVTVDIVVHDHDDGKRYLAFHVHQFSDSPVVCRNNSPDDVKPKDRLAAGEIYVRPTTGKPRTEKVTDAARLHALGPGNTIEEACVKYIQAVFRAKEAAETADDFWGNKRADKAYRRLFKAIADNTPADLKWQSAMWEIAGSTAEKAWEQDVDEQTYIRGFCRIVNECLDDLAAADWIACVPLEHVFCNFPEFTNFGEFSLVNPGADPEQPVDELLARFRSILTTNFGVNFMPHTEVNDSYLWLGDHYYQKSGRYIPGRPHLIVKVSRGEAYSNERLLWELVAHQIALLALCQIACDIENPMRFVNAGECTLPSGQRFQRGLIEMPSVAVAINVRTGQADWWSTRLKMYGNRSPLRELAQLNEADSATLEAWMSPSVQGVERRKRASPSWRPESSNSKGNCAT